MNSSKEWTTIKLGDLVEGVRGVSYQPHHLLSDLSHDAVILLRANNIQNGRLSFSDTQIVPKVIVKKEQLLTLGDTAVCMSNGSKRLVGKSAQYEGDLGGNVTVGAFCSIFRTKEGADSEYVKQIFHSAIYQAHIDYSLSGSAINNLKNSDIESLELMVPPKVVQQKIARILQSIDQAIEKTKALIDKYQQIKAGLMHDLFTRGIGADAQLRPPREQAPELYQETPIGWIPKEWSARQLKDMLAESGGHLQTGPFGSQLHSHEYTEDGVPVVMPQDINNGKIEEFQIARITEARARRLLKHRLRVADIIVARRGDLSRAAAVSVHEQGWVCGTGCFLLRLGGSELDARFFSMIYRDAMIQRQVAGLAIGSTMPSLNNEIMGKLIFPYLNPDEQASIADRIDSADQRIVNLRSELQKLLKEESGLMHDLLAGKVSVRAEPEAEPEAAHV